MKPNPTEPRDSQQARYAYEGLDRTIHERARLSILTSLVSNPAGLTFNDLKQLCNLTDGNLARHLQVLEKETLVRSSKEDDKGRPQTLLRITATGRRRFLEYLSTLEQVVRDAAAVADEAPTKPLLRKLSLQQT